jgi:hypothetical protein
MPGSLAILATALGCSSGQEVNSTRIDAAKRLWAQAGIRDYTLEWSVTGPNNAHYVVTVREGEVRDVESIQPDGARVKLHPGQPRYFGVDGLFLTIADELAMLTTDRPFGQPRGATVLMRFEPDPRLGYPLWYRRDVAGTLQSVRIAVISLVPTAAPTPAATSGMMEAAPRSTSK